MARKAWIGRNTFCRWRVHTGYPGAVCHYHEWTDDGQITINTQLLELLRIRKDADGLNYR